MTRGKLRAELLTISVSLSDAFMCRRDLRSTAVGMLDFNPTFGGSPSKSTSQKRPRRSKDKKDSGSTEEAAGRRKSGDPRGERERKIVPISENISPKPELPIKRLVRGPANHLTLWIVSATFSDQFSELTTRHFQNVFHTVFCIAQRIASVVGSQVAESRYLVKRVWFLYRMVAHKSQWC